MSDIDHIRRVLDAFKPSGYVEDVDLERAREELDRLDDVFAELERLQEEIGDLKEEIERLEADD